jgi:hypothetical protein
MNNKGGIASRTKNPAFEWTRKLDNTVKYQYNHLPKCSRYDAYISKTDCGKPNKHKA